jgi:hypothetical protein
MQTDRPASIPTRYCGQAADRSQQLVQSERTDRRRAPSVPEDAGTQVRDLGDAGGREVYPYGDRVSPLGYRVRRAGARGRRVLEEDGQVVADLNEARDWVARAAFSVSCVQKGTRPWSNARNTSWMFPADLLSINELAASDASSGSRVLFALLRAARRVLVCLSN